MIVALPGHTPGHLGIALKSQNQWLLHAGDSYYNQSVITHKKNDFKLLAFFEKMAHMDYQTAQDTLQRIQNLPSEIKTVCSHDASFFPEI